MLASLLFTLFIAVLVITVKSYARRVSRKAAVEMKKAEPDVILPL